MYSNFKEIHINKIIDLKDFFDELKQYVDAYYYLLHPEEFSKHHSFKGAKKTTLYLSNLQYLDNKVVNMFLMNVFVDFDKNIITIEQLNEILYTVQTYILRRTVCSLPANTIQKVFRYLHRQISSNKNKLSYMDSFYYNLVISKMSTKSRFPTNSEFYESLISSDIYKNNKICKFLLVNIETYKTKNILNIDELTIEHIMPQTLTKVWKEVLGEDYLNIHSTYINRIGNLTLTSFNSELSNKSLEDKLEILRDEGHIKMNEYFKNINSWDVKDIENRTSVLSDKLLNTFSWPVFDEDNINNLVKEEMIEIEFEDLYDLQNVKSIKSIKIDDNETDVKSYRDIYVTLIECVYSQDKVKFHNEFVDNENYTRMQKGSKIYSYALNNAHSFDYKVVTKDEIKIDVDRNKPNLIRTMKQVIQSYDVEIKIIIKK